MIIEKLGEDFYYHFFNGTLINAYEYFGCHIKKIDNCVVGGEFLLYAPNAKEVSLICEFNKFTKIKMNEIKEGFYYIFVEENIEYSEYKYVIKTKQNNIIYKSDPYAVCSTLRPNNNSKVYDIDGFNYSKYRRKSFKNKPISIYEIHIGSWNKKYDISNYRELSNELITYLLEHKFTHVEFMPLTEYPLDDSWGYMSTGYFCATSRYGYPKDLMKLIDDLHKNNIFVILDFIPGHICRDDFGLYKFDDTYLYEYSEEKKRENISWGTANLDLSKGITKTFLISSVLFWLKYYKIDGLRIDAVSNLIYYLGDKNNGVNQESISFLKLLNKEIKKYDKNILITAEDSSDYPDVTSNKGLGFDFKWNMGWMNDSLTYFKLDPLFRKYNHKLITFSFTYCFNEKYILPISHDEVVHLKKTLLNKMFGNTYEKFSNIRLFLGYMFTHPGKKLLFMGQEFGVLNEWDFKNKLNFELLNNDYHYKLNEYFKDLNKIYVKEKSLYKSDDTNSLVFIEPDNNNQSVFVYSRKYNNGHVIVILNALPIKYSNYKIGVLELGVYKEILNSDNTKYGGSGFVNKNINSQSNPYHNQKYSLDINLAPLSIVILKYKMV